MKTTIIGLVLLASFHVGLSQPTQQVATAAINGVTESEQIHVKAFQLREAVMQTKDIHAVEELLKEGADINAPIACGSTALNLAVDTRNLEMVKFLLAHGAKPGGGELADAAFCKNPDKAMDFVKVLLAAGINPNATNTRYPYTPITSAASAGHRDVVALLLAQPGIKVDAQDREGDTALMLAARKGSLDLLELLLKAGANPDLMNYRAGIYPYTSKPSLRYTPIISAASRGNRDVVAMLLANPGIKVDAQDEDGNTAMMSAARNGSLDIVELLLKAGADPNLKNNRGKTAADLTEEGPEKEPRFVPQPWLRSAIISKLQSKNQ